MTTAPFALTYDNLLTQVPSYLERIDAALLGQLPALVALAENRLAADMKQQGFLSVVQGEFEPGANGAVMQKPAFWRETVSFNYKDPVNGWSPIRLRDIGYIRNFWPIQATLGYPRFYADYNATHFLLAPSPLEAFDFELSYYARLQPLCEENQTNWLTVNAPQCLLYATILEAQLWLKNESKAAFWENNYNTQKGAITQENAERLADKNEVVTRG